MSTGPGSSQASVEHFCTLFDANYLPIGLALYESLQRYAPQSRLWVICLDERVQRQLAALALPKLSTISLAEIERAHPRLAGVKPARTWRAYCWTLSPFVHQAVFAHAPAARRVTYLDADLYFFDSPHILLDELDRCDKHVLMTEHAYAPEYAHAREASGRFCVQFITCDASAAAGRVLSWWQEHCLEWCHDRVEGGKFGDQKYLEEWPRLFGNDVHVVEQVQRTLAPWNASHFSRPANGAGRARPVFYHFHSLRIIGRDRVRLYAGYQISAEARWIYDEYLDALSRSIALMEGAGMDVPTLPLDDGTRPRWLTYAKRSIARVLGRSDGMVFAPLPQGEQSC